MKKTNRLEALSLRVAGGLILLIGLGHVLMPTLGYSASATAGMSVAAKDHFYFLGTYAICSFLLAFSALSIAASYAPGVWTTRTFSVVMAAVWTSRVILEVRYPVALQIYVLRNPHPILLPILLTIALAFTVAAWAGRARSAVE